MVACVRRSPSCLVPYLITAIPFDQLCKMGAEEMGPEVENTRSSCRGPGLHFQYLHVVANSTARRFLF